MRRIIVSVAILGGVGAVLVGAIVLRAQPGRLSPHESVRATVDGARLTIVYGRPSMRGRTIFGVLVPYGDVWCPGADEATTLESSRPLRLGDLTVPTGPHTIWMLPDRDRWTLIVSKEREGFHSRYPSGSDLGRVALTMRETPAPVERLTFAIAAQGSGGTIAMTWERTEVSVPFTVAQ